MEILVRDRSDERFDFEARVDIVALVLKLARFCFEQPRSPHRCGDEVDLTLFIGAEQEREVGVDFR